MHGKPNKNRKGRQAEVYIYIAALDEDGYVNKLLLTKKEFDDARKRALSNPEDTFGDVVAFQIIDHDVSHEIVKIKPEDLI